MLEVLDSLERSMGLDTAINCGAQEILAREVVADYWTRRISLTWKTTPTMGMRFELWLVAEEDRIVQWYIAAGEKVLDVHIDAASFERLNTAYRKAYEREVDPWELFQSQTAEYGKACGIGGLPPEERTALEDLVARRDMVGLDKWLSSPAVELQLYALEGLIRMRAEGHVLTPYQERCIAAIRTKKGDAKVCHGCIGSVKEIHALALAIDR